MEIQKIFSNQYDEERYYSVLMSEDELALYEAMFSEEEEDPKKKGKGLRTAGKIGMGVGAAGMVGGRLLANSAEKTLEKTGEFNKYLANLEPATKLKSVKERYKAMQNGLGAEGAKAARRHIHGGMGIAIGGAAALTGAGLYAAGKIKQRRAIKKANSQEQ